LFKPGLEGCLLLHSGKKLNTLLKLAYNESRQIYPVFGEAVQPIEYLL